LFVVAIALALRIDVFLAEMAAAGFVAFEGVAAEEFAEFEEVGDPVRVRGPD
jgi:hypothetical protein